MFLLKKALVKTAHSIKTVLQLCFFVTLPPTSLLEYVALLYCHTSSGKASESGARRARFLIFWLFSRVTLKSPLQRSTSPGVIGYKNNGGLPKARDPETPETLNMGNHQFSWEKG
jgi:hypothetical protein